MNTQEQQYLDLLAKLLEAPLKEDRTGTGTHSIFGHQMRFDLSKGFPLLTTKKVHFKSLIVELLWFLKGDTNIRYLLQHGCTIWTEWRYKAYLEAIHRSGGNLEVAPYTQVEFEQQIINSSEFANRFGDIGKGYGHQWRNFGEVKHEKCDTKTKQYEINQEGFDQISWLINEIKTNPDSRRLIVSGWNPHEVNQVDLPPCHTLFQFYVEKIPLPYRISMVVKRANLGEFHLSSRNRSDEEWSDVCDTHNVPKAKLSCQLYQRSADVFLGVPFNIASYALLTHMIAQVCNLGVGDFVWTGGDVHLYSNHVEQAKEQLTRQPYDFPQLVLNLKDKSIFDLEPNDINIVNYQHHPAIKAPVAI